MAIVFELVVNFGDNNEAAARAAALVRQPRILTAGAHRLPLHRPLSNTIKSSIEFSVIPVAISWGGGVDGDRPRIRLTAAELTELGHQLYDLLAEFDGYVAAQVGWDPEDLVDSEVLHADLAEELRDGTIHGLVLSEEIHAELGLGDDYVEFQPGYRWIPFRGVSPGNVTAD